MRIATLIVALPVLASCSRPVAYVDLDKAVSASADARHASETASGDLRTAHADFTAAMGAASKLTGDARTQAEQKATAAANATDEPRRQRYSAAMADVSTRAARVLEKLRAEHRLSAVQPALAAAPDVNLTAELTKRLDAGDGRTDEQEEVDLRQKAATASQEKARADAAEKALAELRAKK